MNDDNDNNPVNVKTSSLAVNSSHVHRQPRRSTVQTRRSLYRTRTIISYWLRVWSISVDRSECGRVSPDRNQTDPIGCGAENIVWLWAFRCKFVRM